MENNEFRLLDLYNYIRELIGTNDIPQTITRQISRFINENIFTNYKDIARTICYAVEEKGMSVSPVYGIHFCEGLKNEAALYFKKLELDRQRQMAEAKKITEYQGNNIIFNIKNLPNKKREPKKIDIGEIDITEGDDEDGEHC